MVLYMQCKVKPMETEWFSMDNGEVDEPYNQCTNFMVIATISLTGCMSARVKSWIGTMFELCQ
jgi:hypothetical protein